jgi:hypothetical protein
VQRFAKPPSARPGNNKPARARFRARPDARIQYRSRRRNAIHKIDMPGFSNDSCFNWRNRETSSRTNAWHEMKIRSVGQPTNIG